MPKGYHHLTRDQRCQIYTLKKRGDSQSEIAREIGVHRSTVYRELKRNAGKRGYRFKQANRKASKRRRLASRRPKKLTPEALSLIGEKLKMQWSPEQIAGWLRKEDHPHAVSHELIYQLVWADKRAGGCLYKHLRHSGKKYNRRSSGRAGRGCIPHRVGIEERPKIVERKCRLGDWEADTIIGKGKKGAIVSVVDRASKLTKLAKVSRRTAGEVREALEIKLGPIKNSVFTLTSDNGKEFASHQQVAASLDCRATITFAGQRQLGLPVRKPALS